MQPRVMISLVAGLLAATAAQACPACGDKLSLVGGGVSFESVARAGPAGRIVLFAEPGSPLQAADTDLGLAGELKRAGHDVKVVTDSSELERVVREQGADIVVAHWSEADATAGRLGKEGAKPPTVLAVAYKTDDAAAAKAAGIGKCFCQAEQHKGRAVSNQIDRILERQRKGQPSDCTERVASRTP